MKMNFLETERKGVSIFLEGVEAEQIFMQILEIITLDAEEIESVSYDKKKAVFEANVTFISVKALQVAKETLENLSVC